MYHKYNDLVRQGDYYRIASYSQNHKFDCWEIVSEDKNEAMVAFVQVMNRPNFKSRRIKLKGLDLNKKYRLEGEDTVYTGEALMYAGIQIQNPWGDFKALLLHFIAV